MFSYNVFKTCKVLISSYLTTQSKIKRSASVEIVKRLSAIESFLPNLYAVRMKDISEHVEHSK
jgi:hypothetical protein